MSISTEKPTANPSRFAKAKDFAKDESNIVGIEAKPEPKSEIVSLRPSKITEEIMLENFQLEVSLGKKMRNFITNSRRFKTKRAFLKQCIIDGLEKYAGE